MRNSVCMGIMQALLCSAILVFGADQPQVPLLIESSPDADVILEGRLSGKTDSAGFFLTRVSPGSHRVRVQKSGFYAAERSVFVYDLSTRVRIILTEKPLSKTWAILAGSLLLLIVIALIIWIRHLRANYIGQFKVIREIGRGGVASVYMAKSRKHTLPLALKVMHDSLADDKDLVEKFSREGKVLSLVQKNCPGSGLAKIFEYGHTNGSVKRHYIAMEYVEGETLLEQLKRKGALERSYVLKVIYSLAATLSCCHRSGVFHRDLSPDNIIIQTESGTPILIDFGIAKNANTSYRTLDGSIAGKPAYMSPEQCQGYEISSASDVYALGILFYCLLEGGPPFTGCNPVEVIYSQVNKPFPKLSNAQYKTLNLLIASMTVKDPEKRISMEELIKQIGMMS
ncbi:MAG TPA: hypothetical protein ENN79_04135 [Desulfobacteraceae bacterium]|nr:hypothetical protein [Desulfobacteraceae bacterium]